MAQRLLLVNPVRKGAESRRRARTQPAKRRKTMARRRTAAQKAATKRMIAGNRKRRAPARARRKAPAKRRIRRVRRNPATKVAQRRTYARTARMNPVRRRRRTIRRNPISMKGVVNDLVMPAAIGAVGAIANDALFVYLPLPAQFKAPGFARYASKGITAVALTWLASMVVKRQTAIQLGVGALTTLTAEIARGFMAANIPALAPAAMEGMGVYTMGYYNPAVPAGGGDLGVYTMGNAASNLVAPVNGQEASSLVAPDGYAYN